MGCCLSKSARRVPRKTRSLDTLKPLVAVDITPFTRPFPNEIVDCILDHLHDNRTALAACSLTCKAWISSSRHHMFSHVVLSADDFHSFLRVLQDSSGHVALHVSHLSLKHLGTRFTAQHPYHAYATADLPLLRSKLPWLKSLTIIKPALQYGLPSTLLRAFFDVEALQLVDMKFGNFVDFVEFVCAFPLLKELSLNWVTWSHSSPAAADGPLPRFSFPVRLKFLHLCDANAIDIVEWLLSQRPIPIIDTLHFDTHKYEPNHAVRRLIEAQGTHLTHLQFDLTFANDIEANLRNSVDLARCTRLRELHLHNIVLIPGFSMTPKTARWAPVLLTQVSPALRGVVLTLLVRRRADLVCFDWGGVAGALAAPRFERLERVVVRLVGTEKAFEREGAVGDVGEWLAEVQKRGILSVEFPSSDGCSSGGSGSC